MLRSRLSTLSGVSRHLSESAYGSASRRTALCQIPTPPRPRPLPIGLARYNSTSTRPPRPNPTKDQGSSSSQDQSYGKKLNRAWATPTKWYPIPIALGALVLLAVQFRKQQRDSDDITVDSQREGAVVRSSKLDGPWQVRVMGALPLRSLSQLWGYLNSLVLPVWFRPFGFKLYARIFGCNLDEMAEEDLTKYESLGEFFYRELKEGVRPIADCPMVSPADGRVLHFGEIRGERVEQVKGITYSLTALLGTEESASDSTEVDLPRSHAQIVDDKNFAHINDIPYSLSKLLGKATDDSSKQSRLDKSLPKTPMEQEVDASHPPDNSDFAHDVNVALELGSSAISPATDRSGEIPRLSADHKLFFLVVYLAPGDYHRFHSPATWVVERRRHFTGDLFSVSPYIANRLKDLFVLNERVALLGRWKYGFFSMVPVGATNVGSIRVNFDESLRTNTNDGDNKKQPHTFSEAVYTSASVLRGQPLLTGEEMGGFRLGSTIVMVFEAPKDWEFSVKAGETIKVGEALGHFRSQHKEDGKKTGGGFKVSIGAKA